MKYSSAISVRARNQQQYDHNTNWDSNLIGYWKLDDDLDFELDYFEYADDSALDAVYHNDAKTAIDTSAKESSQSMKITCDWYTGGTQRRIIVDNSNTRWGPYDFDSLGVTKVGVWVYIPNADLIGESGINRFTYYIHTADNSTHGGEGWYRQDTAVNSGWNYIESNFTGDYSAESSPNNQFINGVRWSPFKNYPRADLNGANRWTLDTDATDIWGTNNGTDFGTVIYDGEAYDNDGTANYIEIQSTDINTGMSVSFWSNVRNFSSGFSGAEAYKNNHGPIMGNSTDNHDANFNLKGAGVTNRIELQDNAGNYYTRDTTIDTDTWYHFTVVFDSANTEYYKNGSYLGTSGSFGSNTMTVDRIGKGYAGLHTDGKLDEITIWNTTLSSTEVNQIYNFGRTDYDTYVLVDGFRAIKSQTATDESSNSTNGTVVKARNISGKFNNGIDFNGTDDYISLGTVSAGGFNQQNITLTAWVKIPEARTAEQAILDLGARNDLSIGGAETGIDIPDNTLGLKYYDGSFKSLEDTETMALNTWYHVAAVTKQGSGHKLYVNGILKAEDSNTTDIVYSTGRDVRIGAHFDNGDFFKGQIDEVAVWSRALSSTEIDNLYKNSFPTPLSAAVSLNRYSSAISVSRYSSALSVSKYSTAVSVPRYSTAVSI